VRSAEDKRLGRPVAVKLLREDLAGVPDVRARFEAEARAAASLSHPNIVAVFDVGEDDSERPYLVMERLPGKTLHDEIARGPLKIPRAVSMGIQVADALTAAHVAGIVHRDVKPGNVLDAGDSVWKVADFGIAKSTEVGSLTTTGVVLCTPGYVAPERLAGEAATPASDLYSLGVVLYEALAGHRPFRDDSPAALAQSMSADPPRLEEARPDVDPRLADVVHRALARDPQERFATATEMRVALEHYEDVAPSVSSEGSDTATVPLRRPGSTPTRTRAVPVSRVPPRPEPWRPSANAIRMLVVAGMLLVVIGLVALLTSGDSGTPSGVVTPTTAVPTPETDPSSGLPGILDDALDHLDETVQP
jgi:serine/threonine protein kinase